MVCGPCVPRVSTSPPWNGCLFFEHPAGCHNKIQVILFFSLFALPISDSHSILSPIRVGLAGPHCHGRWNGNGTAEYGPSAMQVRHHLASIRPWSHPGMTESSLSRANRPHVLSTGVIRHAPPSNAGSASNRKGCKHAVPCDREPVASMGPTGVSTRVAPAQIPAPPAPIAPR